MLHLIWLIPLLPLTGVAVIGTFGRRLSGAAAGRVGTSVVLAAFLLSIGASAELAGLPGDDRVASVTLAEWLPLGEINGEAFGVDWGFALDPLSALLLLVVTGVGLLVHVYAVGASGHGSDAARFVLLGNGLTATLCTVLLADNLLVLFVGWVGAGLCSAAWLGLPTKAFAVGRIGEAAVLVGMLFLVNRFGTLDLAELAATIERGHGAGWMLTGIALLLALGACCTSAQIPFYVWLPDASAAPAPAAALIQASATVAAGVYLIGRMHVLFGHAPEALGVLAAVGAATALLAAFVGLAATDIARGLAFAAVGQLGFVFAALGVGARDAAIFHLATHAVFGTLLVLGAGSVTRALQGERRIEMMGGLRESMPWTFRSFLVGALAIVGMVPFAGFFSRDAILRAAWSNGHPIVWGVLAAAALVTAVFVTRLTWRVFFGRFRGDAERGERLRESPGAMVVPMTVLALLTAGGGFAGAGVTRPGPAPFVPTALVLLLVVGGVLLALSLERSGPGTARRLASAAGPIFIALRHELWVDELYELVVARPLDALSRGLSAIDRWIVGGLVNAAGIAAELAGQVIKLFQTGLVRNYALTYLAGAVAVLWWLVAP